MPADLYLRRVQIPCLVLDCDVDVDVQRDSTYKAHIAAQVRERQVCPPHGFARQCHRWAITKVWMM